MATTYCLAADVVAVLSQAGVDAAIDDDETGAISVEEEAFVTAAIERSAVELNAAVGRQYILSEVTANDWLKWANAVLAASRLATRRSNPLPESLGREVDGIKELLTEISWGRMQLPEQSPSFQHTPTVTNFKVEIGQGVAPIRVSKQESTGDEPPPDSGIKRHLARDVPNRGYY